MRLIVLLAIVFLAALALGVTVRWLLGSGSRARERLQENIRRLERDIFG